MYSKILVPIDGSETSNRGLAEAIRVAKLTGGRLKLMHVVDVQSFTGYSEISYSLTPDIRALLKEAGEAILGSGRATVQAAGVPVETELLEGLAQRVCEGVVDTAQKWGAELIVVGTHGRRGLGRVMLGSDAEQIARTSAVPVLLVRGSDKALAAH